jgi:hypothetical protein
LVGLRRKVSEKKEGKKRMVSEGLEEGSVAPLELSDRVMEQVEAMAKELRNISGGIWALVEGVGKLTEAVVGLGKKEGRKERRRRASRRWTSRRRRRGGKMRAKKRRKVRKKKKKRMTEWRTEIRRTEIRRWRRVR